MTFLDINISSVNGIEFARSISKTTLVIFTTAYSAYTLHSYELDAVEYLVKPIDKVRFRKAVEKSLDYHALLVDEKKKQIDDIVDEYVFEKSDRRFFKINLNEILFIKGLIDHVIIHKDGQPIINRMTITTHKKFTSTYFSEYK